MSPCLLSSITHTAQVDGCFPLPYQLYPPHCSGMGVVSPSLLSSIPSTAQVWGLFSPPFSALSPILLRYGGCVSLPSQLYHPYCSGMGVVYLSLLPPTFICRRFGDVHHPSSTKAAYCSGIRGLYPNPSLPPNNNTIS